MYKEYFGIDENPFSITPNPRYLYMSRRYQEALAHLLYGVGEGGGFVMLTGEVGTGKTTVCRCLLEQLPDGVDVAMILNPRMNEIELMASICDELRVVYPKDGATLKTLVDLLNVRLLELHAQGRHPVLIIDEAQNLSPDVLEQVRLLTNLETATKKLLQIILVGQPELKELLDRRDLRQLSQRITARFHLLPLTKVETKAYIAHRLSVGGLWPEVFSRRAMEEIHRLSDGVPRLINILCDRCMLGAYAKGVTRVDKKIVRESAKEVQGIHSMGLLERSGVRWALAAGMAAFVAAGLVLDPTNMGLPTVVPAWRDALNLAPEPAKAHQFKPEVAEADDANLDEPHTEPTPKLAEPEVVEPIAEAAAEANGGAGPADNESTDDPAVVAAEVTLTSVEQAAVAELSTDAMSAPEDTDPTPDDQIAPVTGVADDDDSGADAAESEVEVEDDAVVEVAVETKTDQPSSATITEPVPSATAPQTQTASVTSEDDAAEPSPSVAPVDPAGQTFWHDVEPVTLESAFVGLFKQWKLNYRTLAGIAPCSRARNAGLDCLNRKGGWNRLVRLNRPALITIPVGEDVQIHAVVSGARDDGAKLLIGERVIDVPFGQIVDYWNGEYVVLWKPPPHYNRVLSVGVKGPDVAWFSQRLNQISGNDDDRGDPAFTAQLRAKVIEFQKNQLIQADGIVGAQTLIHLNSASRNPAIPLLHKARQVGP